MRRALRPGSTTDTPLEHGTHTPLKHDTHDYLRPPAPTCQARQRTYDLTDISKTSFTRLERAKQVRITSTTPQHLTENPSSQGRPRMQRGMSFGLVINRAEGFGSPPMATGRVGQQSHTALELMDNKSSMNVDAEDEEVRARIRHSVVKKCLTRFAASRSDSSKNDWHS